MLDYRGENCPIWNAGHRQQWKKAKKDIFYFLPDIFSRDIEIGSEKPKKYSNSFLGES